MKRRQGERRILAVSLCGLALMLAYFAIRTVPMSRLTPLSPAVGTDAGTREVTTPGVRIDINTAGLEDLMSLPNIGEVRARVILADREARGPFRYPEDLIRVEGIGQRTVEALLDYVTTGGEGDAEDFGGR